MNYSKLIKSCIVCIKTYNKNIETPDSHCELFIKNITNNSNERMFIKQVFYGVLQYKHFLKVFTEKLFEMNISSTERKDEHLYSIFLYLTLFRLKELSIVEYKNLVLSQDNVKMNEFFKFIFDFDNIQNNIRPKWIEILDFMYVDNKLIYNLKQHAIELSDFINYIKKKALGKLESNTSFNKYSRSTTARRSKSSNIKTSTLINPDNKNNENINNSNNKSNKSFKLDNSKDVSFSNSFSFKNNNLKNKKITIPQPFNLTKVKPKKLIEPIRINNKVLAKPIPYNKYNLTNLKKIEEQYFDNKIKNYEITSSKYSNDNFLFKFKTEERPMNLDKIKNEVEAKRNKELKFNSKFVNELKDFSNYNADVKYNETAILREEYLIYKKKKEYENELNKILIEKKDSKEFFKWRNEMEKKQNLIRQNTLIKRKVTNQLTKESAINYHNIRLKENQLKVQLYKKEEESKNCEKEKIKLQEFESKKKLVKEIEKERGNYIIEKNKLIEKNKEMHNNQIEDYKDKVSKAKAEKAIEDQKRKDIILQIRELEKIPIKRTKGFDPSETPGYGLLEEMSIVELRERLEQNKQFVKEWEDSKREEIKIKNEDKIDILINKANIIAEERDKRRNKREIKRKEKLDKIVEEEKIKQSIHERNLLEVKSKIEKKKKKLKKEEEEFELKIREIKLHQQYLKVGRNAIEEKAFKQIEEGIERKINVKQNKDLIEQYKIQSAKVKFIYNKFKNNLLIKNLV